MNATRIVGIVLGMASGAGLGYFLSKRVLFGSLQLELYVLGGAVVGAILGLMVRTRGEAKRGKDGSSGASKDDNGS